MSPAEKKNMVRRDHPQLSITQQCRLVKLSRSSFYYAPVGIDAATLELMKAIDRVFTKYPFFGSRQIAAFLRREGKIIGRHRVRRLMAKMGLEAIYKRPNTSKAHPHHPVYPYLLRKMKIDRPNQVWCSDITFIPVQNGIRHWPRTSGGFQWLIVSGGHHGLGNEKGLELEVIQYTSCGLLRGCAE